MEDVTPLMDTYRECVRHLWNSYFQRDALSGQDWDLRDEFNDISLALFRALVLRKIDREDFEVMPDHWAPRTPLPFLRLVIEYSSTILINREMDSGYWDHPLKVVAKGDLDLHYIHLFDWSDLDFRDFAFYRVRIVGSGRYPEVVGKDALIPVGHSVKVLSEGTAQQSDVIDNRCPSDGGGS